MSTTTTVEFDDGATVSELVWDGTGRLLGAIWRDDGESPWQWRGRNDVWVSWQPDAFTVPTRDAAIAALAAKAGAE